MNDIFNGNLILRVSLRYTRAHALDESQVVDKAVQDSVTFSNGEFYVRNSIHFALKALPPFIDRVFLTLSDQRKIQSYQLPAHRVFFYTNSIQSFFFFNWKFFNFFPSLSSHGNDQPSGRM